MEVTHHLYRTVKHRIFYLLESRHGGTLGRAMDIFIMLLICLNVIAVIASTVDSVVAEYGRLLRLFELVSVVIFTIEYAGRLWSCSAIESYEGLTGRLRFASRPALVIDLLAILPFYLGAFVFDLRMLRAFRLFRFIRVLKLARYSDSMQRFVRVAREKRDDLTIALFGAGILLLVASSLMYYAERAAQPEVFSSIPAALWWGVVTLTTVGYGDVYPVTPIGKVLGAAIALLGVGLVALPASILASGFIKEAESEISECPHCGGDLDGKRG